MAPLPGPRLPDPPAARAVGRAVSPAFGRLDHEWDRLSTSPAMQEEARGWAAVEPALGGGAAEALARVSWSGYRPSAPGALVLAALLRRAHRPLTARALLQALLPRIRAERVGTPTYGHGVGESWPRPADTAADLVAESFAAICRHAGEDRKEVDRLIVGEASRRLRTARQAQRRWWARTVALSGVSPGPCLPGGRCELTSARSGAEWLAGAVVEAFQAGRLEPQQAALLYATLVMGLPASEAGRRQAMAPRAVYHALESAEKVLLAGLQDRGRVA
ncbi:MAG: hypothetical protein ACRDZX_05985 [Acidimicrobiales bacterium]